MNVSPIKSINGVTDLPTPNKYTSDWEDQSRSGAGRTEDGVMHPEKIGTARSHTIEWDNLTFDEASKILKTFAFFNAGEIFSATVLDLELGEKDEDDPDNSYFVTKDFYVGNRNAPITNMVSEVVEQISIKIISKDIYNV